MEELTTEQIHTQTIEGKLKTGDKVRNISTMEDWMRKEDYWQPTLYE